MTRDNQQEFGKATAEDFAGKKKKNTKSSARGKFAVQVKHTHCLPTPKP